MQEPNEYMEISQAFLELVYSYKLMMASLEQTIFNKHASEKRMNGLQQHLCMSYDKLHFH